MSASFLPSPPPLCSTCLPYSPLSHAMVWRGLTRYGGVLSRGLPLHLFLLSVSITLLLFYAITARLILVLLELRTQYSTHAAGRDSLSLLPSRACLSCFVMSHLVFTPLASLHGCHTACTLLRTLEYAIPVLNPSTRWIWQTATQLSIWIACMSAPRCLFILTLSRNISLFLSYRSASSYFIQDIFHGFDSCFLDWIKLIWHN